MKQSILILITILTLSCSKDTNNTNSGGGNTGGGGSGASSEYYLTALVDNVAYKAIGDTSCILNALNDTVYHLKSYQMDNKAIEIVFGGNLLKGTYDITQKRPKSKKDLHIQVAYLTDRNDLSKPYYANQNSNIKNGTLTIEEINSTFIKGTFDVKIDNINITNGKFKCKINGTILIRDTTTPKYIAPCDTPYTHSFGTVSDIDGNIYKTIQIGTQLWMAENLKTTRLNDGSTLKKITSPSESVSEKAYCWLNIQDKYKDTFGGYYNYYSFQTKKLCPVGWRIPNKTDYDLLIKNYGLDAIQIKCSDKNNWNMDFSGTIYKYGSNRTGFSLLPTGNGRYGSPGGKQSFQFSFDNNNPYAFYFSTNYFTSNVIDITNPSIMQDVYSCRCIKE
ncbi:MAG: FISUMP domain-containing protein [Chitinophagales bacterium]|jgi:uncharacterized protein (TIGR02145 family)